MPKKRCLFDKENAPFSNVNYPAAAQDFMVPTAAAPMPHPFQQQPLNPASLQQQALMHPQFGVQPGQMGQFIPGNQVVMNGLNPQVAQVGPMAQFNQNPMQQAGLLQAAPAIHVTQAGINMLPFQNPAQGIFVEN